MTPRLRPATAADEPFLIKAFAASRDAEFGALAAADPALVAALIEQQYRAQRAGYGAQHPGAERSVILVDDGPVGSIEVDRAGEAWQLLDIVVLTAYRGQGIGTATLEALLADAAGAGVAVDLHVLPWNPALRLYERLGFAVAATDPTRLQLTRPPAPVRPA